MGWVAGSADGSDVLVVAALWIGLEGWLFGGLTFDGPPSMGRRAAFFVSVLTPPLTPSSMIWGALFKLVVVTVRSFCVDDHVPRYNPSAWANSKI